MSRNGTGWSPGIRVVVLLPLAMAAYGFQLQPIKVTLGTSGETDPVMTTKSGGLTMSEKVFASGGSVTAPNSDMYTLPIADGTWTAQFDAHEIMVTLGTSGETVTITQAEDGSFWLGEMAVRSGKTVHVASNGNEYLLIITTDESGSIGWMATHRAPMIPVMLGLSGDAVTLRRAETMAKAGAGNTYSLTLVDGRLTLVTGIWTAQFDTPEIMIPLGISGETATITQAEDGSFWLEKMDYGMAIRSGETVEVASNGSEYVLSITTDESGAIGWMASYRPSTIEVMLGLSGDSVMLRRAEDGSFWLGEMAVRSGKTVHVASNGDRYKLITVTVGQSEETVTITQAEDGTYWLGEMAIRSGETIHTTANGNEYVLRSTTDENGNIRWMATYRTPMIEVMLGRSGDSVTLRRAENGIYWLNDTAVESGVTLTTASNGDTYALKKGSDGRWLANYMQRATRVMLGRSGDSVTLQRTEDGYYWLGEMVVRSGETVHVASNGNEYVLRSTTDKNGNIRWTATYRPSTIAVMLGRSGDSVTLRRAEDGSYWLGFIKVESGVTKAAADSGRFYTLVMHEDGMWTAIHATIVELGLSGSTVTIIMNDDGSYSLNGELFKSGGQVQADNGNKYTLTTQEGEWTAKYMPESMEILGAGGLMAVHREDGNGYDVDGAMLGSVGNGDIKTKNSGTYRVVMQDGMLFGTRLDNVMIDSDTAFKTIGLSAMPKMLEDDKNTVDVNESNTALVVAGEDYPFSELLGNGVSQTQGKNFVSDARTKLLEIRKRIVGVLEVFDSDSDRNTQVQWQWGTASANNSNTNVKNVLESVFGTTKFSDLAAPSDAQALMKIDELIEALSSVKALARAFGEGGALQDVADEEYATSIFDATSSESKVTYGMYGSTRFGTISRTVRKDAASNEIYSYDPKKEERGAFAFGVTEETAQARHVQTTGTAIYEGVTLAVSGADEQYQGDIQIGINFASQKVDGLITNFATADGEPWEYLFGDVDSIVLPTVAINPQGLWEQNPGSDAKVDFGRRVGSRYRPEIAVDSTFEGRLIGGNSRPDAGSEVVGVWSLGSDTKSRSYLAGGFGAARLDGEPFRRNAVDDGTEVGAKLVGVYSALENGKLTVKPPRWGFHATSASDRREWQITPTNTALPHNLNVEISLSELLAKEGSEFSRDSSKTHVGQTLEEITELRERIVAKLEIGGLETSIKADWLAAQAELLYSVFHDSGTKTLFREELPGRVNRDGAVSHITPTDVVDRLDHIIKALSSADGLDDAFDPAKDGIFVVKDTNNEDRSFLDVHLGDGKRITTAKVTTPADMFNENQWQIKSAVGTTDYTRFGVWQIRYSKNALRIDDWQDNAKSVFAYSPLPMTTATSRAELPDGGEATYEGKTVAYVGTVDYEGEVQVHVRWYGGVTTAASEVGGSVTTVISDLRDVDTGGHLYYNGKAVRRLTFNRLNVSTSASLGQAGGDHLLNFRGGSDLAARTTPQYDTDWSEVRIGYRDPSDVSSTRANLNDYEFVFVGNSPDGPLGVIGWYNFNQTHSNNRFGTKSTEKNMSILGSFGADLP